MLKIFDNLAPFFNDCYRRISVREYARLQKISPPTASKLLQEYYKKGFLKKEYDRQYHYYYAEKDSSLFRKISVIHWEIHLKTLLDHIEKETLNPVIILFGSFSKAEVNPASDIDIAVFTPTKKEIDLKSFEKKLKRNIQLFMFKGLESADRKLLNNILNGERLRGKW
ncbi:MAG: nucleotidyltransferase domain-containing protein [Nanobdellota archaeon]